jgi:hypothetical protein
MHGADCLISAAAIKAAEPENKMRHQFSKACPPPGGALYCLTGTGKGQV